MSKAANILALSEASCSDTFSLHSLSQMVSLSTVFFRPVIYCNVLIDVYLFAAVSHPKSVSDEQPGRIVSQAPASDRKLHLSAFVCFTSFSFSFFILRRTIFHPHEWRIILWKLSASSIILMLMSVHVRLVAWVKFLVAHTVLKIKDRITAHFVKTGAKHGKASSWISGLFFTAIILNCSVKYTIRNYSQEVSSIRFPTTSMYNHAKHTSNVDTYVAQFKVWFVFFSKIVSTMHADLTLQL